MNGRVTRWQAYSSHSCARMGPGWTQVVAKQDLARYQPPIDTANNKLGAGSAALYSRMRSVTQARIPIRGPAAEGTAACSAAATAAECHGALAAGAAVFRRRRRRPRGAAAGVAAARPRRPASIQLGWKIRWHCNRPGQSRTVSV